MSDWWSTLDSEHSQNEVIQMDTSRSPCTGQEFAHSQCDHHDGLCISVRRGQMKYTLIT